MAYGSGLRVAAADVSNDGRSDIVTRAGVGGGRTSKCSTSGFPSNNYYYVIASAIENVESSARSRSPRIYRRRLRGGGRCDGGKKAEIGAGQGKGAGGGVRVIRASDSQVLPNRVCRYRGRRRRLAQSSTNTASRVLAGPAPGAPKVRMLGSAAWRRASSAYDPAGGVFVGEARFSRHALIFRVAIRRGWGGILANAATARKPTFEP